MSALVRNRYGAGPLHLITAIAGFAIAAYALTQVLGQSGALSFVIYFAGAIVIHDLVAFPLYSGLTRVAGEAGSAADVPAAAANYVRVPALLSAFAFVVWFPLILGLDTERYEADVGHPPPDYLGRWLLLTAVLFLGSGCVYAIRLRARARGRTTDPPGPRSRR